MWNRSFIQRGARDGGEIKTASHEPNERSRKTSEAKRDAATVELSETANKNVNVTKPLSTCWQKGTITVTEMGNPHGRNAHFAD